MHNTRIINNMGHVITLAQKSLHDPFKGELELYLKSQYPGFNLNKLPNKRVVKLGGVIIPQGAPTVIDHIILYCKENAGPLSSLKKLLPSFRNNERLIRKKMKRLGLNRWFLYEDIKKSR